MPFTTLPTKANLNGTPTTGVFKSALGALYDAIEGLFGAAATPASFLAASRILDPQAIYNLSLVPTVGSNALTMTIKSRDAATDLSAANPGFVGQRSVTPGSGLFNLRQLSANVALTISSGSTLGHLSGVPAWIYWYLIDNAGAQELAASSSFFGLSGITSTTAEGGAGNADNPQVMYSATARSDVPYRCIGRSRDSQAVAGTWTVAPSAVQMYPFQPDDAFPTGTMLHWPSETAPHWALIRDGAAISRAIYADLFDLINPVLSGTTTNASAIVTGLSSTKRLFVGMKVEGAGVPAGATVASIQSATQFTLSANASASATVPLRFFPFGSGDGSTTFNIMNDLEIFERGSEGGLSLDQTVITGTTTNASTSVTGLSSTVGLYVGMPVTAVSGITGGTTIAAITSATAITLSANATATGARALTFTGRQFISAQEDAFKAHTHEPTAGGTLRGTTGAANTAAGANFPSPGAVLADTGGAETRPRNRAYLPIIAY